MVRRRALKEGSLEKKSKRLNKMYGRGECRVARANGR